MAVQQQVYTYANFKKTHAVAFIQSGSAWKPGGEHITWYRTQFRSQTSAVNVALVDIAERGGLNGHLHIQN